MPHRTIWSWYTGRWWVGCYIWYSDEGPGRGRSPPRPLLAVPNATAHPPTASEPITVFLYHGPLLCGFNVPIKEFSAFSRAFCWVTFRYCQNSSVCLPVWRLCTVANGRVFSTVFIEAGRSGIRVFCINLSQSNYCQRLCQEDVKATFPASILAANIRNN